MEMLLIVHLYLRLKLLKKQSLSRKYLNQIAPQSLMHFGAMMSLITREQEVRIIAAEQTAKGYRIEPCKQCCYQQFITYVAAILSPQNLRKPKVRLALPMVITQRQGGSRLYAQLSTKQLLLLAILESIQLDSRPYQST
jgi:hypothetical protein